MKSKKMYKSLRNLAVSRLIVPAVCLMSVSSYAQVNEAKLEDNNTDVVTVSSTTAKQSLMTKLTQLAHFTADFNQKILSESGDVLQQGTGNLAISKPNLVNWKTITPDETLIISDGSTLWFFDPFIEQASAYSLASSISNTPILLLTSDDPKLWQQYDVAIVKSDNDDIRYEVKPKAPNSQIKTLTLAFKNTQVATKTTQLTEFSFQDTTGQISLITLSNFNSQVKPNNELFSFSLPEGVRLEDKR